jgi:hypothetical protein
VNARPRTTSFAVALLVLALGSCTNTRFNTIAPGGKRPDVASLPDAIDLDASGHLVHLDPTVMLWARDAKVDLREIVRTAIGHIDAKLHGSPTQVSISAGSYRVIPDVGIGGSTDPRTGEVIVSMDARSPVDLRTLLLTWLPLALAHELHHSTRILDGPGYGTTLLDTMMSEGGAEAFVRETYPHAPSIPWVRPLSSLMEHRIWREAKPLLDTPDDADVYERWFLGKGNLPRWTGYRLGYVIVRRFLARHPRVRASDVALLRSTEIFDGSAYDAA